MTRWRVLALLSLAAAAIGIYTLAGPSATGGSTPWRTAADRIVVDPSSVGGKCDDARHASQAHDPRTPVCTLKAAVTVARPGTRVELRRGTYPPLTIVGPPAGRGWVTIAPDRSERVTVRRVEFTQGAGWLRFERLRVPDGIRLAGAQDPAAAVHHVAIVGCTVSGRGNDAVLIEWGSHDVLLEGNRITSAFNGVTLNSVSDAPGAPPHRPEEGGFRRSRGWSSAGTRRDKIGTDAIRPANFDDLLVEGNDITGVVESGDHSDALQVVWGGRNLRVRNNVIHDIQGQGLFIKDGLVTNRAVIEGNRLLRGRSGPQIALYETNRLRLRHNTVRGAQYGVGLATASVTPSSSTTSSRISPSTATRSAGVAAARGPQRPRPELELGRRGPSRAPPSGCPRARRREPADRRRRAPAQGCGGSAAPRRARRRSAGARARRRPVASARWTAGARSAPGVTSCTRGSTRAIPGRSTAATGRPPARYS